MFNALLASIGTFITGVFGLIGDVFTGVVAIFYTPGAEGAAGQLTFLGDVIAWTAGVGLVGSAIYIIYRLIRSATSRLSSGVRAIG